MISGPDDSNSNLPEVVFFPSPKVKIKCPGCGFESSVTFGEPFKKALKVYCKSCKQAFMLIPNVRDNYRKPIRVFGYVSRLPGVVADPKKGVHVKITDISATGMGFEIPKAQMDRYQFAKGEPLYIVFHLPGKDEGNMFDVTSEIKNVFTNHETQLTKLGVKFDNLDLQIEKSIKFFLW